MKTKQKGLDEASQICTILNSPQRLMAFKQAVDAPTTLSDILGSQKDNESLREHLRISLVDLCELGILTKERPKQNGEIIWAANLQTQDQTKDFFFCAEEFEEDLKDLSNTQKTALPFEQLANTINLFREPERIELFKLIASKQVSNATQAIAFEKLPKLKVYKIINEFVASGILVSRKTRTNEKAFALHPKIKESSVLFVDSLCKLGQKIVKEKQSNLQF